MSSAGSGPDKLNRHRHGRGGWCWVILFQGLDCSKWERGGMFIIGRRNRGGRGNEEAATVDRWLEP